MKNHNLPPKKPLNKWISFSQAGLQMGITIALCTFLGQWLDGKYPNEYSLFTVGCSLMGVFAAIYTVIKKVLTMNRDEE